MHNVKWLSVLSKYNAQQFCVTLCFSVEQQQRPALHASLSTTTFCTSCMCIAWQPFSLSVDWLSRTNTMASVKFQS